jgi:hypothetical protein
MSTMSSKESLYWYQQSLVMKDGCVWHLSRDAQIESLLFAGMRC